LLDEKRNSRPINGPLRFQAHKFEDRTPYLSRSFHRGSHSWSIRKVKVTAFFVLFDTVPSLIDDEQETRDRDAINAAIRPAWRYVSETQTALLTCSN